MFKSGRTTKEVIRVCCTLIKNRADLTISTIKELPFSHTLNLENALKQNVQNFFTEDLGGFQVRVRNLVRKAGGEKLEDVALEEIRNFQKEALAGLLAEVEQYLVTLKHAHQLCIENRGRDRADKAELFVRALRREEPSGSYKEIPGFVPMSLRWAHSEPDHPEVFVTISPEMQRSCLLGALKRKKVQDDSAPYREDDVYFELWTKYKRSREANELRPGAYRVELLLGASGMSPKLKEILVTVPSIFDHEQLFVQS